MAASVDLAREAWRQIELDWLAVDGHWQGVTRDRFEAVGWAELDGATRRYLAALDRLQEALDQVRRLPRP